MPLATRHNLLVKALPAVLLLTLLVVETGAHGAWWAAAAGLLAPDLALAYGAGRGLAQGRLHPRAVPLYNAVHRWWPPLALLAVAMLTGPAGLYVGALAWTAHVAVDRACGYGLRDAQGFQR